MVKKKIDDKPQEVLDTGIDSESLYENTNEVEEADVNGEVGVEAESDKDDEVSQKNKPIAPNPPFLKRLFATKKQTILSIVVIFIVALAILSAIPYTRYSIAGFFIKRNATIVVIDSATKRPVSGATVTLGNQSTQSDKNGDAILKSVPVGDYNLSITKKYYESTTHSYTMPITSKSSQLKLDLTATGRQVTIKVTNKISGDPLEGVKVSASGTNAITDAQGTAVIILPASKATQSATLSDNGFNSDSETISVNNPDSNSFTLTPSGIIYYLSNITGTTNIMKSNLDGSNSTVVVSGTGFESASQTTLLATTDWQYMALLASRQSDGKDRLYVLDAKNNSLKMIDQSADYYQLIGWSGHIFYYIDNVNTSSSQYNGETVKSYDAETGRTTQLDQTQGSYNSQYDYQYDQLGNFYIEDSKLVFTQIWYVGIDSNGKPDSFESVTAGGDLKDLKDFSERSSSSITVSPYEVGGLYIQISDSNSGNDYYEYEDGLVKSSNISAGQFDSPYPTYLISPSANKTLWYQVRNSKNTLFVGDENGANGKQIDTLSDYTPFGWYSDDYIVLSKDGVLYVASANKTVSSTNPPIKIASYQPTNQGYPGYSSGYGASVQ